MAADGTAISATRYARRYDIDALRVFAFGLFMVRHDFLSDVASKRQNHVRALIGYLNGWLWIVTVFGWGHRFLNKPMKWLPYAAEAVYPWYILHQTFIVVVGYNLSQLQLGPIVEPTIVLVATVGGCLVLHEYVIRRIRVLRLLFVLSRENPSGDRIVKGRKPDQAVR